MSAMLFTYLFLIPVALIYLTIVRSLRYRRIQQLQKQHGSSPSRFKDLNYKDAQKIIGQMGLFEFPWIFLAGKDFAFLRVSRTPSVDSPKTALTL
jgi:hypothetical protein